MTNILERHELGYLQEWAARESRKPLVIRGARQVGKSTLVREFARVSGMALVEINLERNPQLGQAFATNDPAEILSTLALMTGEAIAASECLLFLDEIQAVPSALASLRYFYEEMPGLRVLAAGSLLELALGEKGFSMPVGRIEFLYLGPMDFEDFLVAVGRPHLAEHLRTLSLGDGFPEAVHAQYLDLLRQYWVVGGLPEAVSAYASTAAGQPRDFESVARVQQNMLATYRTTSPSTATGALRNGCSWCSIDCRRWSGASSSTWPSAATTARANSATRLYTCAWRALRGRSNGTAANGLPLGAEVDERHFKCLTMDVGMMCAALHLNTIDLAKENPVRVNGGAVAEQFVGQHLLTSGLPYEAPVLHYWAREARNAAAEVDYVLPIGRHVVPVEVKAGTTGSLRSLHQFLTEKRSDFAVRLNGDVPSLLHDARRLADGSVIDYRLLSLPLYLAGQVRRLAAESLEAERAGL